MEHGVNGDGHSGFWLANLLAFFGGALIGLSLQASVEAGRMLEQVITGLEPSVARFQALSAFSGTDFTTREAEIYVSPKFIRNLKLGGELFCEHLGSGFEYQDMPAFIQKVRSISKCSR